MKILLIIVAAAYLTLAMYGSYVSGYSACEDDYKSGEGKV